MEGLYRKKGGAREQLTKDKKGLFEARTLIFCGERRGRVFCRWPLSMRHGEGPCDRLPY